MNTMWLVLAVLSFVGGQVYLFGCLRKVDRFLDQKPAFVFDDSCRYPEDVVE